MKQHSRRNRNGARPAVTESAGTGVTAVLDSMISATDQREIASMEPLADSEEAPESLSEPVDVDDGTVDGTVAPNPRLTLAPVRVGEEVADRLPEPANHIRFSEFALMGQPMWNVAAATALGLPSRFLDALDKLEEGDEWSWMSTLVEFSEPLCSDAEDRPALIVSSGATYLAEALGLAIYRLGSLPPYGGSVYCAVQDTEADFDWIRRIRGDRDLHLLLNGTDTDWIAFDKPTAISYTSSRGALEALKLADATGAVIAFGTNSQGLPIRATSIDLALAIRPLFRTR